MLCVSSSILSDICNHTQTMSKKVCVLGAGIIGLSSALCIKDQLPECDVTIVADVFTPNTTSDFSAGLWLRLHVGHDDSNIRKWSSITYDYFHDLAYSEFSDILGLQLLSGYYYLRHGEPFSFDPPFKEQVLGFRKLSERELRVHPTARAGFGLTTFVVDVKSYMVWLTERFKKKGGKIEIRTIRSLSELMPHYDVIVNCAGMRANQLVKDKLLRPIRGQVIKVYAPWVKHFYFDRDPTDEHRDVHIIPGIDTVTLGGTAQYNDWNTEVDQNDKQRILEDCCKLLPSLRHAKILRDWVGLRPQRTPVRLEVEGKVIHNYGHSAAGITLHWGCALDASKLVKEVLQSCSSKL